MNDLLELETRRKIFNLIFKNPGVHLSKISEVLKMRSSLVEYHLFFMEKNNIVTSEKEKGYTRYYIKDKIGVSDKKFLSLLRQEIPLRIVLFLIKKRIARHKEILENFNISPSTLTYHLKKLLKNEIIEVQTYGDEKGYSAVNREDLIKIIIQYKPYTLIDGFKDTWLDFSVD